MSVLSLQGIQKSYSNGLRAVSSFDLTVEAGEFVTLLGPSGCGKTTTLRCIAGLERPDAGIITIDGAVVLDRMSGRQIDVPTERRGLAMVFQQYALWPHMSVFENVAFGLRSRHASKAEVMSKTERALRTVRLWEQRDRQISQLSGGQQQRISLARAIAPDPKVVLFDEPLSNLDVKLRDSMRIEILELQRELGLTSIYVTHDQDEAFSLSSRIVVMSEGQIEQVDVPAEVWMRPATPFVAGFIGMSTSVRGTARSNSMGGGQLATEDGLTLDFVNARGERIDGPAVAYIRAGELSVLSPDSPSVDNEWHAHVEFQSFHGDYTLVFLRHGSTRFVSRRVTPLDGQTDDVRLHIDPANVRVYAESAGARVLETVQQ